MLVLAKAPLPVPEWDAMMKQALCKISPESSTKSEISVSPYFREISVSPLSLKIASLLQSKHRALSLDQLISVYHVTPSIIQGLRASSLQFTSPLEFNVIFRDGFPLRVDLNGWSKIRNPVTAKFKHVRLL